METNRCNNLGNNSNTTLNNTVYNMASRNSCKLLVLIHKLVRRCNCFHTYIHHQQLELEFYCLNLFQLLQ